MANRDRLIQEFCKLVSIDSISFQEREMGEVLKLELFKLGFEVIEDRAGDDYHGSCGNIYGYLKGDLEGDPILYSAHMDTVEPGIGKKAILHENGQITSDGSTVLGADDLSGVVCILEAIRMLKEQRGPHRSIEVLFTIAEEVYIQGSKVFDYKIIKSKEAYVLDLDGPVGTAAIKAPTLVAFTAKIIGRSAHAGFAPEQGIHAITIAAEMITQIKQGRIDVDTTVNIGTIEGGKARNIVPDECILQGEVRSLNHEKALSEAQRIEEICSHITEKHHGCLEFSTSYGCIAYEVKEQHPVIKRFLKVCKELNYEPKLIKTFGGSDNNNFLLNGITGIVLACGMNKVHSCSEYTNIDELIKCSNIIFQLMTSKE